MAQNRYTATIVETLRREVFVFANSAEEAEHKVKEAYRQGDIILTADDIADTEISDVRIDESYNATVEKGE